MKKLKEIIMLTYYDRQASNWSEIVFMNFAKIKRRRINETETNFMLD